MKEYLKITIHPVSSEQSEILISELADIGFYAFEEEKDTLNAFIERKNFNLDAFNAVVPPGIDFRSEVIIEENWNRQWEEHFEPVIINDFAAVRAKFHRPVTVAKYDIIITPKMSFGTGHHATTYMMMELMKSVDFTNKNVIDFGTGTGVLAILAEKVGAKVVNAIDNDDWSIENAKENVKENQCEHIKVFKSDVLENLPVADIILANINLNVLISNAQQIYGKLKPGGDLLLSGILPGDENVIVSTFSSLGFNKNDLASRNGWLALGFKKFK